MIAYSSIKKNLSIKVILPVIFFMILAFIPLFTTGNYLINIMVNCMVFSIFGLAWNLIGGYGGQVSWCSAAFVAIGAYTNFILNVDHGISPFISLPLGALLSVLFATLIGYGTLRLRGAYFSIATIAFAESLRAAVQYFAGLTKGSAGIYVTYRGHNFWMLTFRNDTPFYFIFLALLVLAVVFCFLFTKAKVGYYLISIKGDEDAAESLGIETFKVKLRAFQISAILTSVAGAFYASFLTYISPVSTVSFDLSIKIGVVAIVGGIGTLWGPVVGAFVVIPLIEIVAKMLGQSGSGNVLYGLLLMIIVIFRPQGLIFVFNNLLKIVRDSICKIARRPVTVENREK